MSNESYLSLSISINSKVLTWLAVNDELYFCFPNFKVSKLNAFVKILKFSTLTEKAEKNSKLIICSQRICLYACMLYYMS